jgi:hypothetical protein
MNRETRGPHRSQAASSQHIGEMQARQQREDFQSALRALLMRPLLGPGDPGFTAVRRQADKLRDWFTRETGWGLVVERDGARLYKRPADTEDATRGLPDFDRRRYVLLCLACAVLERANLQTTLRELGEKLMEFSLEPDIAQRGFSFTLTSASERRELVTVCRLLLNLGVLTRVAGDEDDFIHSQTGLVAEQRAEGLALTDDGTLTDIAMPAEGTEAHVTLLVAEYLATRAKHEPASGRTTSATNWKKTDSDWTTSKSCMAPCSTSIVDTSAMRVFRAVGEPGS